MKFWTPWKTQAESFASTATSGGTPILSTLPNDWSTWQALINGTESPTQVSRDEIMALPGFVRARDVFCSLGNLPLHSINGSGQKIDRKLFTQPESTIGRVRSVTMANLFEDLLFDAVSLWVVVARDATDYPTAIRHYKFGEWSQDEKTGRIRIGTDLVPAEDVILFESPNAPLRKTAAGTVQTAKLLAATANRYANSPQAVGIFKPNDGSEPEDDVIQSFLGKYRAARQKNVDAFLPENIDYVPGQMLTADELQLIGAREFLISEASRLTGLPSSWLGLNTTTRTYSNAIDERKDLIDFAAKPFLSTIEQRLSLGDVTPNGQVAKWSLDGFLRSNTTERYQSYKTALEGGWLTVDEIRSYEDLPKLNGGAE
ncbi:phage portal protein [Actinoplanes derwentensis]|uniref:Phage portal protein n=1 Tax=Actinoplanes derwentensis TaxID=113562 RepID=A0A1H1V471_9ACTN|nr:phage portal protein [Actinoplanes derwentensis]GID90519.1 hypothetical protein Ade03nite_94430 [Actinoplanes derwentensis]SDS79029.1 Phage portal protein [Actinoplanes derwentensis]